MSEKRKKNSHNYSGSLNIRKSTTKMICSHTKHYDVTNTTEAGSAAISPFGVNGTTLFTEFINVYSEDNPILNTGDTCFFLLMNTTDYFLPVICEGIVKDWKFSEGLTKTYYLQFVKFHDSLDLAKLVIINRNFFIRIWNNKENRMLDHVRITLLSDSFFYGATNSLVEEEKSFLFSVNSFFVRGFKDDTDKTKQLNNIMNFRKEYLKVINNDMLDNLKKLELFKTLINQ